MGNKAKRWTDAVSWGCFWEVRDWGSTWGQAVGGEQPVWAEAGATASCQGHTQGGWRGQYFFFLQD